MKVRRLSEKAVLPKRQTAGSAGYDLSASGEKTIPAGGRRLIPTDLIIQIPSGHYGRIAPRSSLALKHGIDVGAGVIDSDYRGPVGVVLFNFGDKDFVVKQGDRIAQLLIEKISTPEIVEVEDSGVGETERGAGGFGSTGRK